MKRLIIALLLVFASPAFALVATTQQIFTAESMGASANSTGINASFADLLSIQAVWAGGGAPNGDFKIQVSNDDVASVASVTNWSDYPSSSVAITGDGDIAYNIANFGYRYARLVYTRTSGTATLNAQVLLKYEGRN